MLVVDIPQFSLFYYIHHYKLALKEQIIINLMYLYQAES